ncbi:phosphorylcholine transferase LicD [uncultured Methanobrevibacter sp.]|uniref:LicD family protein n=1 Tax=uncultured Methanobrevibacter sp. TaxID=253161 RepID=UPI0026209DE3|nr:LicD family protein [uncultured Methanobrevibacter sp.]
MDFEKIYAKLPGAIKYNNHMLNFFLKVPKKLQNLNKKSNQLDSQNQLLDLLFTSCDIKIKGTLRNVQLLYVELLRFLDNVCKKHDIDYWIDYGTLLGAVRHGGFIPWDDDIDLSIMRKDYEKLIKVLPEEISKYEYFKENCGLSLLIENQKNYFEGFKSVYDVNDENNFLDGDKFSFLQIAWLKPYVKIDLFPKDYLLEEKLESFKKNYVSTKYKFNYDVKSGKKTFWSEFNKVKKDLGLVNTETKYLTDSIDVLQLTPVWIFETDKMFPLKTIKFEEYEFKCPKDINYALEVSFGKDYMHIPSVIENHSVVPFIEHQFDSVDEMNESFSKSIGYLKEINDNFFNE